MRQIFTVFIIVVFVCASCEVQKTFSLALKESIEEFSKNVTIEKKVYIPEMYSEREVDTLLSNVYHIRIKTIETN